MTRDRVSGMNRYWLDSRIKETIVFLVFLCLFFFFFFFLGVIPCLVPCLSKQQVVAVRACALMGGGVLWGAVCFVVAVLSKVNALRA